MNKKKELFKDTIILFFSKALTQFISIIMLPLYTSKLSTSDYGIVEIVTNYIFLLMPLVTLQIEMAAFRYLINEKEEEKQNSIITNSIIVIIFMMIVVTAVFLIINGLVKIDNYIYIVLMFFSITIANILMQFIRGLNKNMEYAIGSIILGAGTVIFNFIFLCVFNMGIEAMYLSIITAYALANIYFLFKCNIINKINLKLINKSEILDLLKYSIPLIPNQVVWWIINSIDRTIIMIFIGPSASGIYAIAHKFPTIYSNAYNVFNLAWSSSLAKNVDSDGYDEYVSTTFNEVLVLFETIALVIIGALSIFFNILIDISYKEAYIYIPLLMISAVFSVFINLLTSIYIAFKQTKKLAVTAVWAGIINTTVNIILVKRIGIYAAPISTIIAFGIMGCYRYIDVKNYINLKIDVKKFLSLVMCFLIVIFLYFRDTVILKGLGFVFSVVVFIIMNKKYIYSILRTLKNKKENLWAQK